MLLMLKCNFCSYVCQQEAENYLMEPVYCTGWPCISVKHADKGGSKNQTSCWYGPFRKTTMSRTTLSTTPSRRSWMTMTPRRSTTKKTKKLNGTAIFKLTFWKSGLNWTCKTYSVQNLMLCWIEIAAHNANLQHDIKNLHFCIRIRIAGASPSFFFRE